MPELARPEYEGFRSTNTFFCPPIYVFTHPRKIQLTNAERDFYNSSLKQKTTEIIEGALSLCKYFLLGFIAAANCTFHIKSVSAAALNPLNSNHVWRQVTVGLFTLVLGKI